MIKTSITTNLWFISASRNRVVLCALVLFFCGAILCSAHAEEFQYSASNPQIVTEISYSGNDKTQVSLLNRQITLRVGDYYSDAKARKSQQALMNLGLFKSVDIQPALKNGFLNVLVTVVEKRYLLLYPRLSLNGDGESSYGASAAWANLHGLNHKAKLTYSYKNLREEGFSNSQSLSLSYYAPYVDEDWDALLSGRYSVSPVEDLSRGLQYEQSVYTALVGGELRLAGGDVVNGYRATIGLSYWQYQRQYTARPDLDSDEYAVGVKLGIGKRDIDYDLFSDSGEEWSISREQSIFAENQGGRFEFNLTEASYRAYLPGMAELPNHNFIVEASVGHFSGGPVDYDKYSVSSSTVRGYEKGSRDGNTFFAARAEYLVPTYRYPSLRWLMHVDSAAIVPDTRSEHGDDVIWSLGLGMRWRPKWFVNLEIDLTMSYPLNGGDDEGWRASGGTRRLGR